jgi:hypothetical protein
MHYGIDYYLLKVNIRSLSQRMGVPTQWRRNHGACPWGSKWRDLPRIDYYPLERWTFAFFLREWVCLHNEGGITGHAHEVQSGGICHEYCGAHDQCHGKWGIFFARELFSFQIFPARAPLQFSWLNVPHQSSMGTCV